MEDLRDALLESYTCFVHGIEGTQGQDAIKLHFPKFIEFLQQACNHLFNPTVVKIYISIHPIYIFIGIFKSCFNTSRRHR